MTCMTHVMMQLNIYADTAVLMITYIAFLSLSFDDMVISSHWIDHMTNASTKADIGAVGPEL